MVVRVGLSLAEVDEVWSRWRSVQAVKVLARAMRRHPSTVRDLLKRCGGIRPRPRTHAGVRLSLAERKEISRGLAAGLSLRQIAAGLSRERSTVSREVGRSGSPGGYRAVDADQGAWAAVWPEADKLATRRRLREVVGDRLAQDQATE